MATTESITKGASGRTTSMPAPGGATRGRRGRGTGSAKGAGKGSARVRARKGEVEIFTRQLATMVGAGIPLLECLEILEEQAESRGFKTAIGQVVMDIRGGSDLSLALSRCRRVFSHIYVNMVKAGEASGQLDEILKRLAEYLEATAALKREIKAAMVYPVVSMCLVFGITAFLMIGIVPKFKEIFEGLGVELPGITQAILGVSIWLKNNWHIAASAMVIGVVGLVLWARTPTGRAVRDRFILRVPVFGTLFQKVALSRFSRTFATLIKSGVPILGSLEIVAETSGNTVIREAVNKAQESVRQGESLSEPLSHESVFPPMVTRMIGIGEKTGALESLLEKISDFYDQQVQAAVKGLTSLIEPLLIAIMGILVGGIVMAVFLPILKLQEVLIPK